jgi:hypothetical protein
VDRVRSEQQEGLELASEPEAEDPPGWQADDPDVALESGDAPPGRQDVQPDDGALTDREPTAIAEDFGTHREVGAEQQAMHVEIGDQGGGRTG